MTKLIHAVISKYEAQRQEALAHLDILLHSSVGIGEHTDILAEVDKWIESLSQAEENLNTVSKYFVDND